MRQGFRRSRLSMTSLIDVIFLLLMFFMLATSFTRVTELPLVAAAGGAAEPPRFWLQLGPESLALNGVALSLEALPARLAAEDAAAAGLVVALAPGVAAQRLADLLAVLQARPGLRVQVLG